MIKKVCPNDIPQCVKVIRESFLAVADEFGFTVENAPGFTAFSTTESRLMYQLLEEHRPMYAFFDHDTVVGFYSLQMQDNNDCELNNLCVSPAYRHSGIGKTLLEHAFETAKEAGCVRMKIGMVEENKVLRSWYESFGFIHLGAKKYDHFPFTCGYMEKHLD